MLEGVIYGFASDYSEKFGFDVSDENSFRKQLTQIIGSSISKAVEYAENDDKLNISTIYERLCSAVRDAVFVCEQEKIAADEKKELNELRKQRTKEENERKAVRHIRNQLMKKRVFLFTVTIVAALAFIAIKFNFKWASVTIIIALIVAAIIISELDKH
jgi:preprotein translocase subunit SecF